MARHTRPPRTSALTAAFASTISPQTRVYSAAKPALASASRLTFSRFHSCSVTDHVTEQDEKGSGEGDGRFHIDSLQLTGPDW